MPFFGNGCFFWRVFFSVSVFFLGVPFFQEVSVFVGMGCFQKCVVIRRVLFLKDSRALIQGLRKWEWGCLWAILFTGGFFEN